MLGAIGVACLSPYFAWRGASSVLDSFLALNLVAPLAASFVASRSGRLDWACAVSAAGRAGLVTCVFATLGWSAWPAALWLAAEPLNAMSLSGRRAAAAAGLVSLSALAILMSFLASGHLDAVADPAGLVAAAVLIGCTLLDLGWQNVERDVVQPVSTESRDHDVLQALGQVVTWHDSRGDILDSAGVARQLFGRAGDALRGDALLKQVHVADRPAYLKALSDAANGGEPVTVEFRVHLDGSKANSDSRAGGTIWVEMRAHASDGFSGSRTVSTMRDASAARQRAADVEKMRVAAESSNELKGRFLATVSHELRTPLNAIIGFSELLTADHPFVMAEERRKEYATIIRNSGHHLLDVVNTLLDVSKIESGNFAFAPEPFDLAGLADGCCDLMQLRAEQASVGLTRRMATDLPDVSADRRACRQILINLLSNAIKFTPAGGNVTVIVARDIDRVVLAVSDDGIGIRETDLPRLGDPFFQAGDLHNRSHEGTGLGLSVVRGLVGLHGGSLVVESGPGVGTTVTVRLPIDAVTTGASRPAIVQTVARPTVHQLERKIA